MAEDNTKLNEGAGATPPVDTPPVDTPPAATPPVDTPPAATPPADTPPADTPPADTPPAPEGGDSFTISDIKWPDDIGLDDAGKTELFDSYKDLFKGKAEAQRYIDAVSEATKLNKEKQAQKAKELETGWEAELKTDSDFGKDFEGNKKLVVETMKKFVSEADMQYLDKFGFTKAPALNRMMLKIAKEFEGATIVSAGQPPAAPNGNEPKKNERGETVFDFTKPQTT